MVESAGNGRSEMAKAESRNLKSGVCPHCGGKLAGEPDGRGRHRYALRRRRGLWHVVFDGEEAQFKHEKGKEHLERHLLIPSGRYSGARAREARGELAGCFVYERPEGVKWEV
jgi:hypothetical protein